MKAYLLRLHDKYYTLRSS